MLSFSVLEGNTPKNTANTQCMALLISEVLGLSVAHGTAYRAEYTVLLADAI